VEAGVQLVLASTSPYRRALLARLGLPFLAVAPHFKETDPEADSDPARLVTGNALGKAVSLLSDYPDSLIIGSDQVAVCDGEILTKPGTPERAIEQLLHLAGREHRLLTAVSVLHSDAPGEPSEGNMHGEHALVVNQLRMRPLRHAEVEAYVRREQPLDCAGGYKSEGLGVALFEYMRGDDPTAIVGLPLITLVRLLRRFGVDPLLPAVPPGATPEPEAPRP
jgi:septum formation protein